MAIPMVYFHDIFDEYARLEPEAIAVVSRGKVRQSHTFAAIQERSHLLASGLKLFLERSAIHVDSQESITVATELPRTHMDFVPLMVAASRLGIPFVLLSTDLPDRGLQDARNRFATQCLRPRLHIVDALSSASNGTVANRANADVPIVTIGDLASNVSRDHAAYGNTYGSCCQNLLCFMFTGGTHRTKVVEVTHAMVLHERVAYRDLWQPSTQRTVVLAHTSVYWGASALGQLSIALAYKGTVVWTEASEAAELKQCVADEMVNVLGVVPDHLDLLAPESPARELPNIDVVFTWGERLPRRTADRWRNHPRAVLRELLIATEYWLSLWADPIGDTALRTVRGTKLLILTDAGGDATVGEMGELMIAGPMVMKGYHGDVADVPQPFHHADGERYFRTRDLVRRVHEGIIYKGRADMMTKHKGKWVDMVFIEDQVCQLDGVQLAKVMADPVHEHFHIFVVLETSFSVSRTLNRIRMNLPPRLQLWLVPHLPRHPVTRKVDAASLGKVLAGLPPSWPIDGNQSFSSGPLELRERLSKRMYQQCRWATVAFGVAWAIAGEDDLRLQISVCMVYLASMTFATRNSKDSDRQTLTLSMTMAWACAVVFSQPPDVMRLARGVWSLAVLTYAWLALTYADSQRADSGVARLTMRIVDELPFWKFGAFLFLSLGQKLPAFLGVLCSILLTSLAATGAVLAFRRRRPLAWPLVFWSLGVGHQLHRDSQTYIDPGYWWRWSWSIGQRAFYFWTTGIDALRSLVVPRLDDGDLSGKTCGDPQAPSPDVQEVSVSASAPLICSRCNASVGDFRWYAYDQHNNLLCDACGNVWCTQAEAEAAEWLSTHVVAGSGLIAADASTHEVGTLSGESMERAPKVPRTENVCDGGAVESQQATTNLAIDQEDAAGNNPENEDAAYRAWQRQQNENWWWRNKSADTFDLDAEEERHLIDALNSDSATGAQTVTVPPEMRPLCTIIGEIEPLVKPVHGATVLIGIDSLQVARLTNAIRIHLGVALTVQQLREAKTVSELADIIAAAEAQAGADEPNEESVSAEDANREYAVWYSPGQYRGMGNWILRSDDPLEHVAFIRAAQQLVDRHGALRCKAADPLRYLSLLYDCAVIFTLFSPFFQQGPRVARWLCRCISNALEQAWPRVKISSREEFWRERFPETLAPVEILQVYGGQDDFERTLKQRRNDLKPPGAVTGFELWCYLSDVWAFNETQWNGRFVIMKAPEGLPVPDDVVLVYVDASSNDWGPLISACSTQWRVPPYGFPALFFVPLKSGAVLWIRLEREDELRICFREGADRSRWNRRLVAFRASPRRGRDVHPPTMINFMSMAMFHSFADGNCYLPLVQDFLTFYDAARGRAASRLPPITPAFQELERRLFDTFHCRPSPMRHSLRGSLYGYRGHGYGYCIGIGPGAISAVTRAAVHYRVPLDVALLGIVTCAMARADKSDVCDFTLYAPMRDGAAEAMVVGLFSDWRDLYVNVDLNLATVLGTVLQLHHKIQHRQWSVFNAVRKSERTVINIQPLDFENRAGFKNLGENMWRDGDQLNHTEQRGNQLAWAQQPATFVIEQQDEETWWILIGIGITERPAPWMRCFVAGFEDALSAFLFDPLAKVHQPFPDDDAIICACQAPERGPRLLFRPKTNGALPE